MVMVAVPGTEAVIVRMPLDTAARATPEFDDVAL
jgi:hypothetical protein